MNDIEKLLIDGSKNGDIESFEKLIHNYEKKAYNIAFRIMGNEEDAKDMAQEAFIRVYRSIKNFQGKSSFSTWLYRIVTNVCLDELRKRKSDSTVAMDKNIDTSEGELHIEICSNRETPEEIYERTEKKYYIIKAINELSEEYKAAIVLRDVQGFSYEEISNILNCSMGTVKSRINRARGLLKDKLRSQLELFNIKGV